MSYPPSPIPHDSPESLSAPPGVRLRDGERLLWAGRPMVAGYARELLWLYPICLLFGAGALVGAWYFYAWAAGAGVLRHFEGLGVLAVILLFALLLFVLPLVWPVRLRRSAYVLTTQRLIIRQPALLVLWPRVRSLDASQAGGVRLKCIWSWLPERTGDIRYGGGAMEIMERVPRAEEVVARIRGALLPPEDRPPPGQQQDA